MRAKRVMFLKMLFWYVLSRVLREPARAMDWLYQYALCKSLITMMQMRKSEGGSMKKSA